MAEKRCVGAVVVVAASIFFAAMRHAAPPINFFGVRAHGAKPSYPMARSLAVHLEKLGSPPGADHVISHVIFL